MEGKWMKYAEIAELINMQEWEKAKELTLSQIQSSLDDELAILASVLYLQEGNEVKFYECISEGLKYNYKNYELYFMLGEYYENKNINQAFLCYENAEFYCTEETDLTMIRERKENVRRIEGFNVEKTSIVVISYNMSDQTMDCVESITEHNIRSSYELVVIDNASEEANVEWLSKLPGIKLIANANNMGFPYACNQGIKVSEGNNNILLLNNDTIIMPNTIFQLRMGLYENNAVGATGSVSNYAINEQNVSERYTSVEEYVHFSRKNNVPMLNPYEKKLWLTGFALMLRREALDSVGMLDTRFSPGGYEDMDLGIRLQYAGWKVILCKNSFVLHYGMGGGKNTKFWENIFEINRKKISQKWGFEISYYSNARTDIIDLIKQSSESEISVLEIGCGSGSTMSRIEYLYPNASVKGIEISDEVAKIGRNQLDIITGNIESMELLYEKECFDYIILADVVEHLRDPEASLKRLSSYLKDDGRILVSIPNIMHKSVINSLLQGEFEYQDSGILDRTHLRFFTLSSIKKMLYRCGMEICDLGGRTIPVQVDDSGKIILMELDINETASENLFEVSQFVIAAGKI